MLTSDTLVHLTYRLIQASQKRKKEAKLRMDCDYHLNLLRDHSTINPYDLVRDIPCLDPERDQLSAFPFQYKARYSNEAPVSTE